MHTGQKGSVPNIPGVSTTRRERLSVRDTSPAGVCNPIRIILGCRYFRLSPSANGVDDDDGAQDGIIKGRNFGILDYSDNVSLQRNPHE